MQIQPGRRADALSALSEMSVNEVYPFLWDIFKKTTSDHNPYVRKVALIGIVKVMLLFDDKQIIDLAQIPLDDHKEDFLDIFTRALKDRHLQVFETALVLLNYVIIIALYLGLP